MSKKDLAEGKKLSGKKVNAENYIQLFEFLMFDPIYRDLHDKAKILYSFLRNKAKYFEAQTEAYENGIENTKSYLDEDGYIYLLADNTELMYILNTSEPTLIKMKKLLHDYKLLNEVPIKDKANRIYILEPVSLSQEWTHIEEIKKLRAENQQLRIEKRKKLKEKKVKEKEVQPTLKVEETVDNTGDLKKLSRGDLKLLRYGDLKNLSKVRYKSFKKELNLFKHNLTNQPIIDEIQEYKFPKLIEITLLNSIDRLVFHEIKILEIYKHYESMKDIYDTSEYNNTLYDVLNNVKDKISKFSSIMSNWLNNARKFKNNLAKKEEPKNKTAPKEESGSVEEFAPSKSGPYGHVGTEDEILERRRKAMSHKVI